MTFLSGSSIPFLLGFHKQRDEKRLSMLTKFFDLAGLLGRAEPAVRSVDVTVATGSVRVVELSLRW